MSTKLEAKDLPCLLGTLAKEYDEGHLPGCETKENQKWRRASASAATKGITEMAKYFPELSTFLDSLENYSLCERHYNQVVVKKSFIKRATKLDNSVFSDSEETERKRLRLSKDNDLPTCEKAFCDAGVQTSLPDPAYEELSKRIQELENFNRQLLSENAALKKRLDDAFGDQQDRIRCVTEIAKRERGNLYNDIISLMKNHERFGLDSLLEYSPSKWLAERNPVVVKFIEALTHNESEDQHEGEKLFKRAVAVDAIYGSRHLKYVSAINLVASAIKYSLTRSRMVIDIDNHIMSSGCYKKFTNWLESLAIEQPQLPKGLLFLAFDNEQKGQKNYLDRGWNTVVFHTVTSFIALNYDQSNDVQNTDPWLYSELHQGQFEELFSLTPGMRDEIDKELINYITTILEELRVEKTQETNAIDESARHQSQTGAVKKCSACQLTNIDNKKRVCPSCRNKLPTMAEINQQLNDPVGITNAPEKSLVTVTRSHVFEKTQSNSEGEVYTPDLFVPDPIGINPNSTSNIRKIFEHIEELSGVKDGSRKWVAVTCDGVPYHRAQKIKKDFPWLILIPGALHEEMNMLKAFVELNWDIDIREFAQCQGYRSEGQLQFFKKCSDHHKSWDSICNIYRHAMASELMWPYVVSNENLSAEGYLEWAKNQTDPMFRLKYEQVFFYLQAIINFRTGVRFNRPSLRLAARRMFAPIWSARRHPIYRTIEMADEEQMLRLKPEVRKLIQERVVTSRSKLPNQHQGHDAILEEINKDLKSLIPSVPSQRHWEIAARNCTKFVTLRTKLLHVIGYAETETHRPRTRPSFIAESYRFRVRIRKTQFVNPNACNRVFHDISGEWILTEEMKRFSEIARTKRIECIKARLMKNTSVGAWRPIPVTREEADLQKAESLLTKAQLLSIINSLTPLLGDLERSRFRNLASKSRDDLKNILDDVRNILSSSENIVNDNKEE
jgi:hypothetical protein